MSYYFGFTPSADLQGQFKFIDENLKQPSDLVMYPYRDNVTLAINAELVDNALINLVNNLPENDSKATVLKVAGFCKSSVNALLKQLLGKVSNEQALKSLPFLASIRKTDAAGTFFVGVELHETLYVTLMHTFDEMLAGNHRAVNTSAPAQLNQLTDVVIKKFMDEFLATLELGMIKRKGADLAKSAISKALSVAVGKIVPSMTGEEAKIFAKHYKTLLFKV